MIYQKNGISVNLADGLRYRLDPRTYSPDEINLVSHGHSDHLPTRCHGKSVVMSGVTQQLLKLRRRATADILHDENVRPLDAGHVVGSRMFFLEGKRTVLYTGDFCTKQKFFSRGAEPKDADVLIVESTFGSEEYVFPATKNVAAQIQQCVDSCINNDESVTVIAYPFGKAQELTHVLCDYDPFVDKGIYEINAALRSFGYDFHDQLFDATLVTESREPFVLITSGRSAFPGDKGFRGKIRSLAVSGWAINRGFKYFRGVDYAFALSDHADFQDLLRFVDGCNPETVYTCHGFAKKFANTVRTQLGIDAMPLEKGQHVLSNYA
ncbi:MAG TPA: MBL fold metallo-hydrolase RNA specificity domain-containing protein [Candidatus Bathyarchaeia archaeon]|nr:MBL fold metallo-hydrolase RNA specificity domain-containing protein [Candidatus Bathyarchaeia archaeon]